LPDARVHYPHVKHPTHQPPPTPTSADRERRHRTIQPTPTGHTTRAGRGDGPDSSGPNSVPKPNPHDHPPGSTPTHHNPPRREAALTGPY